MSERIKNTTVNVEVEARRKRAEAALASGQYRIERVAPTRWTVTNGDGVAYNITVQDGKPVCDCPDYRNRGDAIGTCKHIEMVRLHAKRRRAQPASPAPSTSPNGHEPSKEASGEGQQPQPQPQPAQADQVAPTGEGLDPVDPVVPFGRHRGKRLSQILAEAPDDLMWIVRKMEARSEADLALKEAAARLIEQAARERAEAILRGEAEMPALPFGEEKGKALDKAHPKWVSILSRKTVQDAFTFADAVLYETARRLQQRRLQERRKKASSLDAEVLIGAVSVAVRQAVREAVLEALEAARQAAADSEAITADLADLRRRVERLEKAVSALRPLAEREAALAAR